MPSRIVSVNGPEAYHSPPMDIVDTGPISLATFPLAVASVGAGMAVMSGGHRLAIGLRLVAVGALGGMVLWTLLPQGLLVGGEGLEPPTSSV